MIRLFKIAVLCTAAACATATLAQEGAFPSKPVRLVVPFPAGNAGDIIARIVGDKMTASTKQSFYVDNRPGAGGNIGMENAVKSPPDGYTVLIAASGLLVANPHLYKLSFDPVKDLAPVILLFSGNTMLVVPQDSPFKTVHDLITYAKQNPGKLNYATYGAGHNSHLMGEKFKIAAGIDMKAVPYKTAPVTDVVAGRVEMMFESTGVAVPLMKAGRLRPLALMGAKRNPGMPEVPSVAEELPGFDAIGWAGALVPAATPVAIVDTLNAQFNAALATAEVRQRIQGLLLDPGGGKPADFAAFVKNEASGWEKVIHQANIKID